jgi:hypothetical protein
MAQRGSMASLLAVTDDPGAIPSVPIPSVPIPDPPDWATRRSDLARAVDRVADRLRGLSQARLAAAVPPHDSRAAAARTAAQALADASAGLSAGDDPPTWRTVPVLSDFAAGDQVAVTGHDVLISAGAVAPGDLAWARGGRRTADEVLASASDALADLRRLL